MRHVGVGLIFMLVIWWFVVATGLPLDPFLLLMLLAAMWSDEWAGLLMVLLAGFFGESIRLAPVGSLVGPLLICFALLRLTIKQFALHTLAARALIICFSAFFSEWLTTLFYHSNIVKAEINWSDSVLIPGCLLILAWFALRQLFITCSVGNGGWTGARPIGIDVQDEYT